MLRALALATLVSVLAQGAGVQDGRSILHVKVTVIDPGGKPMPVPRHVLLVSDNPPTAPPRRIQTALDGTAGVRLRPGNYTVESDQPLAFHGKTYQWTQSVDVSPGRDAVLELTADNADVAAVAAGGAGPATSPEADPSSLLLRWQESVVAVWSPTARASGFVTDARGLVVTNQRVLGTATSAEVQITPAIKLAARVLVADPVRDVAVLWIDPKAAASVPLMPPGCTQTVTPIADGQEVVALEAPLRRGKGTASGRIRGIEGRVVVADLVLEAGGTGGPAFGPGGRLIGITSLADEDEEGRRRNAQVVRIEEVCASIASAELKIKDAAPPGATHLPVEPARPFPLDALEAAARRHALGLSSYRVPSSSYDITFITPVLTYAAQRQPRQGNDRDRTSNRGIRDPRTIDPLENFSNWSAYVADFPPVLMIRVTPKLVEGFWTKIARGAAQTQGVSVPPITRFKPGFARLQAFCGDVEVTPIHPFRIEQRVSESDAIYEGLYVFDPGALGPPCGAVRLVMYSEKDPQKGETRAVDPAVLQRIWEDFAPYRR